MNDAKIMVVSSDLWGRIYCALQDDYFRLKHERDQLAIDIGQTVLMGDAWRGQRLESVDRQLADLDTTIKAFFEEGLAGSERARQAREAE